MEEKKITCFASKVVATIRMIESADRGILELRLGQSLKAAFQDMEKGLWQQQ